MLWSKGILKQAVGGISGSQSDAPATKYSREISTIDSQIAGSKRRMWMGFGSYDGIWFRKIVYKQIKSRPL